MSPAPTKFQYTDTIGILGGTVGVGDPYVDTAVIGDWNGFGGAATISGTNPTTGLPLIDFSQPGRNIENYAGVPDQVSLVMNMGGALGDSAWSDAGETPVVSVHCRYDFFAPYYRGMVRVPVAGQFWDVVDVAGSHTAVKSANITGNNSIFVNAGYNDVYTQKALSNPFNVGQYEGIYTMNIPPADPTLPFAVNSNPWDYWDPTDPLSANGKRTSGRNPRIHRYGHGLLHSPDGHCNGHWYGCRRDRSCGYRSADLSEPSQRSCECSQFLRSYRRDQNA